MYILPFGNWVIEKQPTAMLFHLLNYSIIKSCSALFHKGLAVCRLCFSITKLPNYSITKSCFPLLHERPDSFLPIGGAAGFGDGPALQLHLCFQRLVPAAMQQAFG